MNSITITLTESAQRAALLAGQPAEKVQTYEVPAGLLPHLLALPWTSVTDGGTATCTVPARLRFAESELSKPVGSAHDFRDRYSCYSNLDCACPSRPADAEGALAYAGQVLRDGQAYIDGKRADRAAEYESAISSALARPDGDWLDMGGRPTVDVSPRGIYLTDVMRADSRIVERRAALARSIELDVARYDREKAAREAAAKAAKAVYSDAIRSLALGYDDIARAATDGYPVERQVLDRLANNFEGAVDLGDTFLDSAIDSSAHRDPPDRAAPSPDAFRLLDVVTAECRRANEMLPRAIGQWRTSRIVRLDVCPHTGHEHKVTAVLATLVDYEGDGVREITFSLESLECEHESEED